MTHTQQISMFELLGEDETPEIPIEKQKKGVKGWVIEIGGIFLIKNGFKENMIGVTTQQVVFTEDTQIRQKNKFQQEVFQAANRIHPNDGGWYGHCKKVYAKRPTWEECVKYVRSKYTLPEKVVYTKKNADFCTKIIPYEEGA